MKAKKKAPKRRPMTDRERLDRYHRAQQEMSQRKRRVYLFLAGVVSGVVIAEYANDPQGFADYFKLDEAQLAAIMPLLAQLRDSLPTQGAPPPPAGETPEDLHAAARAAIKQAAESAVAAGVSFQKLADTLRGLSADELDWAAECYNAANLRTQQSHGEA